MDHINQEGQNQVLVQQQLHNLIQPHLQERTQLEAKLERKLLLASSREYVNHQIKLNISLQCKYIMKNRTVYTIHMDEQYIIIRYTLYQEFLFLYSYIMCLTHLGI